MRHWISYSILLFLFVSVIRSVPLDGTCSATSTCDGTNLVCRDGKCRCNGPWYRACKDNCGIHRRFVYEGDECEVSENCGDFMQCVNRTCRCIASEGYVAKNGLCYKPLNATCNNDTQCWSRWCTDSRCRCRVDYEPTADNISCRRKLVNIYNTFNEASQANDLCSNRTSCVDVIASCTLPSINSTSGFCKCPPAHNVVDNNQRCEPVESALLSPLITTPLSYGECGTCRADNAVCMNASRQRTCWCRAGYLKSGDRCVRDESFRPMVIFPNSDDRSRHNFATNCVGKFNGTNVVQNNLCTCAPGYKFQGVDQRCYKIQPVWQDDVFEYGLCTRITSKDLALADGNLCPAPSRCEEREDKHVCSCGRDQFIDLDNSTECVHFIGRNASSTGKCPSRNAFRNPSTNFCECNAGFRRTDNDRRCGLGLSAALSDASCSNNRSIDNICRDRYGQRSILCSPGECRCSGDQSFPNRQLTRCYAPVNTTLGSNPERCPPHSNFRVNRCECERGFYPSSDLRRCEPFGPTLIEYAGIPPVNTANNWNTDDCVAYFTGPVQYYSGQQCQCQNGTFVNDAKDGCWYLLGTRLPNAPAGAFCPPNSSTASSAFCVCDRGFAGNSRRCEPITDRVYANNDASARNITGIDELVCNKFFGQASNVARTGLYCVCRDSAFSVRDNKYCHFYVNAYTSDLKGPDTCPPNTYVATRDRTTACVCNSGYRVAPGNRSCETANIPLIGNRVMTTPSSSCSNYTNTDCVVKYGPDSYCHAEQCYCDQRTSFMNNDQLCEPFSKYTFPAEHELPAHTCIMAADCGDRENVECTYLIEGHSYKVCQCKSGFYLNPRTQTCESPVCVPACNETQNFECQNFTCVCKAGYYLNGATCVRSDYRLELEQPCNTSAAWTVIAPSDSLVCDISCERARCAANYRTNNGSCERYRLGEDPCNLGENDCSLLDSNAICSLEENTCLCGPSFYQVGNRCARAVNSRCSTDNDCGGAMLCEGGRCQCNKDQREEDDEDVYGRPIKICLPITKSGVDSIRFNLVFFVLLVSLRLVFN